MEESALFFTDGCVRADRCLACGAGVDLAVQTATTPVGVVCMTLCPACTSVGVVPRRMGMAEAVTMSLDHCVHLGITADDMDAAMTPTRFTRVNYGPIA